MWWSAGTGRARDGKRQGEKQTSLSGVCGGQGFPHLRGKQRVVRRLLLLAGVHHERPRDVGAVGAVARAQRTHDDAVVQVVVRVGRRRPKVVHAAALHHGDVADVHVVVFHLCRVQCPASPSVSAVRARAGLVVARNRYKARRRGFHDHSSRRRDKACVTAVITAATLFLSTPISASSLSAAPRRHSTRAAWSRSSPHAGVYKPWDQYISA